MHLEPTKLAGCYRIELEKKVDDRGFFARSFSVDALSAAGIDMTIVQANWSSNRVRGTVRGMHYQESPHGEPKIVSCVRGDIFDVFIDLRPNSSTFGHWDAVTLSADSLAAVYLPVGIAHGFQSLTDGALVQYWMGAAYVADAARGVRFDDPALAISWPMIPTVVSERDRSWPLLSQVA